MLAGQLDEVPAGGAAAVHDLDGLTQGGVGDGGARDLLQLGLHVHILVHGELQAERGTAILGVRQEDAGQLALHSHAEVLAHGAQRVADGGGDDAVQLIHGAVQQHLQGQLGDGAVEGGAVLLGHGDGLLVAAPDAHGHHTGSQDQLHRSEVRQNANDLLALVLIAGQHTMGVLGHFSKLFPQNLGTHFASSSFFALLASMASTRP